MRQNVMMKLKDAFIRLAGCAAAGAVLLYCTGCEFPVLDVDNYMRPPAASGYSAGIQQALYDELGQQFTLRYPRSGDYRSAVVLADVDGREGDEAIVFYRMSTENSGAHMMVLACVDEDEWDIIGAAESNGGEIDRVLMCDVNGDGVNELVSGWSGLADGGVINIHSISDGALNRVNIAKNREGTVAANEYSEMVVGDFDGDGRDELMTACRSSAEGTAYARMLKQSYGADGAVQLSIAGSVTLDGSIYKYDNAQAGCVAESNYGMVLDGCRSNGTHTTEIVCWDKEKKTLTAPVNNRESHAALLSRTLPTLSRDIDADGIIEIPDDEPMPGFTDDSADAMYFTVWREQPDNGDGQELRAVMRADQGYYFVFPESWEDAVTAKVDQATNTMFFFAVTPEEPFSEELFRIKIFTRDEWSKRNKENENTVPSESAEYIRLAVTDYYVYAALLMPEAEEYGITEENVTGQFHLD